MSRAAIIEEALRVAGLAAQRGDVAAVTAICEHLAADCQASQFLAGALDELLREARKGDTCNDHDT